MRKRLATGFILLFLAAGMTVHAQSIPPDLQPITPGNAAELIELARVDTPDDFALMWMPDGARFAVGSSGGTLLYSLDALDAPEALAVDNVQREAYGVAVSSDSTLVATSDSHNISQLYDLRTDEMTVLQETGSASHGVAFSPNGRTLALPTTMNTIVLWDVPSESIRAEVPGTSKLAFSPGSDLIATLDPRASSVLIYEVDTGAEYAVIEAVQTPVSAIAFSPDGTTLAYGAAFERAGGVFLWDVASKSERAVGPFFVPLFSQIVFSPDGAQVAAGANNDLRIGLYDATTGESMATLTTTDSVLWLTYSPNGQLLASAGTTGVQVWDADGESDTPLAAFELGNERQYAISGLTFNPQGNLLLAGAIRGPLVLFGTLALGASPEGQEGEDGEGVVLPRTCTISAPGSVNLRETTSTEANRVGSLAAGQTAEATGQARGADGFIWYQLRNGMWARSDVINTVTECGGLPVVQ